MTPNPSPDATTDLDRFCTNVWADTTLQDRLRTLTEETAFIAAVQDAAAASGLRVDVAVVLARMHANATALILPGILA